MRVTSRSIGIGVGIVGMVGDVEGDEKERRRAARKALAAHGRAFMMQFDDANSDDDMVCF